MRIKIYCYIAICGLLWSNWCEYKRMCGVEFGEYPAKQYQYAKEYFDIVKSEIGIRKYRKMNRVRRAIIMAAGYGNRMLPIARNIPKPLIKVNGTAMVGNDYPSSFGK